MRRCAALLFFVVLVPRAANAQATSGDSARAEALFQESKTLIDAGDYTRACPKLTESYRLDPGAGTLLALALCHERQGKTATAFAQFKESVVLAKKAGRADREKPLLSHLTVVAPEGVGDVVIRRDGVVLARRDWGARAIVDPGVHVVEASAPGKKAFSKTLTVDPITDEKIVKVLLEDDRPAPTPSVPSAPPEGEPASPPADKKRIAGFVVGGVGIIGLGVGTVFGVKALGKNSDAKALCANPSACNNPDAVQLSHDAGTAANISNVALLVGLAGLGIGTYLVLTSGPPTAAQVTVAPAGWRDGGGISVRGLWF
jgi:hypothetical protein